MESCRKRERERVCKKKEKEKKRNEKIISLGGRERRNACSLPQRRELPLLSPLRLSFFCPLQALELLDPCLSTEEQKAKERLTREKASAEKKKARSHLHRRHRRFSFFEIARSTLMALSSRRSSGSGGGGVPFFLNAVAVTATTTSSRTAVVLRAQPSQPLFWPRREREGRGRSRSATTTTTSHHRRRAAGAAATDADADDERPFSPSHLVRLATRQDLPALVAIERACGHYEWGPEALKHELESPLATLLVAEVKGGEEEQERRRRFLPSSSSTFDDDEEEENKENEQDPRPSASASLAPSPSPISGLAIVWNVADETQILELAVHPSRRRRGAAKALLSAALASSPAAASASSSSPFASGGRAVLEVASRNAPAVSLYASFGFGVDGVRKRYYRDGDDALLMSLRIGGSGEEELRRRSEDEDRDEESEENGNDSAPSSPATPPG